MHTPDFLIFSKTERAIIIILFVILICFYGYIFFLRPQQSISTHTDLATILQEDKSVATESIKSTEEEVKALSKKSTFSKKKNYKKSSYKKSYKKAEVILQRFDPNQIDSLTWISLGVGRYTVSNILKYRSKGGFFRTCDALYKIYGLDSSQVTTLLPYCYIDASHGKPTYSKSKYENKAERIMVDINTADTTALKTLKGVGSVYAAMIVKYRGIIGGFRDVQGITKVYGIEQEVIDNNIEYLTCSPPNNLIDINTATIEELNKLYAINYKQSKIIINYRDQHGPFQKLEDLKLTKVLTDSMYLKMLPYITLGK